MSVYINGMEMPSRCCDCKMYVEDIYCCHLLQRGIENPWADDGVELDCPLIPVPDHGRLIDGDAMDAYLKTAAIMADGEAKEAYIDARAEARTMPIIIPAEEGET